MTDDDHVIWELFFVSDSYRRVLYDFRNALGDLDFSPPPRQVEAVSRYLPAALVDRAVTTPVEITIRGADGGEKDGDFLSVSIRTVPPSEDQEEKASQRRGRTS